MGRLSKPMVPDGPVAVFYDRLHELHIAAGRPSTRDMQRRSRSAKRPNGFNPTTVHDAFSAPRLSRWEVVREIVGQLGGDVDEFGDLWRRAYEEQEREASGLVAAALPARPQDFAGPGVPSQLPADVPGFTGRTDHLKRLDELAPHRIVAIAGMPGVGKTSLVVHFAHQVRHRFPDGQIFVSLRAHSADAPVSTTTALAHLLQAMGVPAQQIPADAGVATGLYRSVLADRSVLVVLDDAASAEQVRPLLPAGDGCLVLVTSRLLLTGLVARDGAVPLELDVLDLAEARALLATIVGADRVAAEPQAANDLARACSCLPLALRVAAANLTIRPDITLSGYASTLAAGRPLEALHVDGDEPSGLRSAFDLSYQALGDDEQRLFGYFGLVPGEGLTVEAAAAMTAATAATARQRLERLATAHLINRRATPVGVDRYTCHDLLRDYAAERADDAPESLRRLYDFYLFTADAAARTLYSEKLRLPLPAPTATVRTFTGKAEALSWLDSERSTLMDVIGHCAAYGPGDVAWLLADTLRGYLRLRRATAAWAEAAHAALAAAEAAGDLRAQAASLLSLGDTCDAGARRGQAIEHFTRAVELCERIGWAQGLSAALGKLGVAHRESGNLVAAQEVLHRGLSLCRETGNRYSEAVLLGCLGRVHLQQGRLDSTVDAYTRALSLFSALGARQGQAAAHDALGEALHVQARQEQARQEQAAAHDALDQVPHGQVPQDQALHAASTDHLLRALALERELGDRGTELLTLRNLAAVHRDAGDLRQAAGYAETMHAIAGELGDLRAQADALRTLASVEHGLGRAGHAVELYARALELIRATGYPYPEIETMIGMAETYHSLGDTGRAAAQAAAAHRMAGEIGYPILADRAQAVASRL